MIQKKKANLTYDESYNIVSKLNFRNTKEFRKWVKNNGFGVPYNPDIFYKNKGWINYKTFFNRTYNRKKFLSYSECCDIVRNNGIKSHLDFIKWVKDKDNITSAPDITFKSEWKSWYDFFGIRDTNYLSYNDAIKYLKNFNLVGIDDFRKKWNTMNRIPYNPEAFYKEWKSWYLFLSSKITSHKEIKLNKYKYNDCKNLIISNNIKNITHYKKYAKMNKKCPSNPETFYKEWKSWSDFLNKRIKQNNSKIYLSFEEAKIYILELNLTHKFEYLHYVKNNNINFGNYILI